MPSKDSVRTTIIVALGVCLACSLLVSATAVSLRPRQASNRLLDKKRNIVAAAGLLEQNGEVRKLFEERIRARVVDMGSGEYVPDMDATTFDQRRASRDPERSVRVPASEDIAGIKRRAERAAVYLVEDEDGRATKVILPVHGLGLWSTMYGFLALDASDLNTIRALVFYEHGETPGLGGEVDNPDWRALWNGKKAYGPDGEVRIDVVKGTVDPSRPGSEYRVDEIGRAHV